ncbi:IS3 family transposase [Candidatus Contubernalis alkaliaceticus]|uniref:IS3 family transposase n=1 Tax=Candidatus Contubernalis alkaliaceticus TaxID=338645 RepID=UPI001F4BF0C2|nr:IS3 family transposase [Candidatus Contubernalis alkalaceticus]
MSDKFKFIKTHKFGHSMEKMCMLLKVSRSGYYDWVDRPPSNREKKDQKILKIIKKTHIKHPVWGVDPIWAEVKETIHCSRGTVYRLMKENGIKSKRRAKWKATTNSKHNLPVAPNLLEQNFNTELPNTVWVGDITYNWTDEGWLYTAIVKDLCTKDVVGYAMGDRIVKDLVIRAMAMAVRNEKPKKDLIFHSDRGSQYCSNDFKDLLKTSNIRQSMSRKGNPYDNACAENFFSCLKCECTNFYIFETRDEAKQAIFEYIEVYYNRQRRHASLGWITPLAYKKLFAHDIVA